ncbi:unnamed protein product [Blepharisma stoltei]|uniref:Uncharacterized protein n=1 Tax=Blepharisma stoltei TaxID=1481888 RepID=A0AAU9J4P2_9CILI|nr:unnamed protein product [Blepharisma stoltei]
MSYSISTIISSSKGTKSNDKFQSFPVKVHDLNAEIQPARVKRPRHLRKNPFNAFYKETPESFKPKNYNKILDGFLLLEICKVEMPNEAICARLSGEGISDVVEDDLKYFTSLSTLDLSDNAVAMEKLKNLESLTELNLMCNKITNIPTLPFPSFRCLETLNLSYNKIHASSISNLSSLGRLESLDLSSNDLCTLPEDLSDFKALKELYLSSNGFSTDSVLFSASLLFRSLSTIPGLQKLDISRNKLRGIHSDALEQEAFVHLRELDFSYNWVDNQDNLMYASNMPSLQILIITGNPFAQTKDVDKLQEVIATELGGTIISESQNNKKRNKAPYARPIAYITQDYTAALKNQLFGVELSKDMGVLPISEINSTQEIEEDIFPPAIEPPPAYKDIYTPSNDRGSSRPIKESAGNQFFLTETEGGEKKMREKAKRTRLEEFRNAARSLLGDEKEYEKSLDLEAAYRQLKHMIRHPTTYQSKNAGPRYSQFTASRNTYKLSIQPKVTESSKKKSSQMDDVRKEIEFIGKTLDAIPHRIQSV